LLVALYCASHVLHHPVPGKRNRADVVVELARMRRGAT
jgi:hypothetical protein